MWVLHTAVHSLAIGCHMATSMLSTPWCSRAVPQPSTDLALHRLAAEFGWDPAFSMQYGRQPVRGSSDAKLGYLTIGYPQDDFGCTC